MRICYLSLCAAMYEERVTGRFIDFVDVDNDIIIARTCTTCDFIYSIGDFYNDIRGISGKSDTCKTCNNAKSTRYFKSDNWKKYHRKYREDNADKIEIYRKSYHKDNPHILKASMQRRWARKKALPDTLTSVEIGETLVHFGGCFLTGSDDYHLDHVIPLASGRGGTTKENMLPLRGDLNSSKYEKNVFEWFKDAQKRVHLSQERFDAGIAYIAKLNGMTTEEYRAYVYECHEEETI